MPGSHRGPVQLQKPSALEHAVDDSDGEVVVVQHAAPGAERLIGREEHRPVVLVALVDDVKEHVRSVGAVGQVADLIHDEHVGLRVPGQRLRESTLAESRGQVVDELCRGDEERIKAVLDGAVGDRDGEMGLPAARLAHQDEIAHLCHEVWRQGGAEERKSDSRLIGEVEVIDGLEEGKACATRKRLQTRLLAMSDLFGDEDAEKIAVGPLLLLGADNEVAPDAPRVSQVKAAEQRIDVDVGWIHRAPPVRATRGSSCCVPAPPLGGPPSRRK